MVTTMSRIVLPLMLMDNMDEEVVGVQGAFLKEDAEEGEEIHTHHLEAQGWEHPYNDNEVLKLKSCLFGLKQASVTCWR